MLTRLGLSAQLPHGRAGRVAVQHPPHCRSPRVDSSGCQHCCGVAARSGPADTVRAVSAAPACPRE
eukprot:12496653-Alexandrium_andersonii.AAC.1